jgi:hypothetical protein
VITKLGSVKKITPKIIEGFFAADLAYLQEFYNSINRGSSSIEAICPKCSHAFGVFLGEGT